MADVDAALEQQVIDVSQGEGVFTYIMTTSRITSGELSK
jgi:predicted methyltransferase